MNREEKERMARITMIDACIIVAFMVIIAIFVRGYKTINPGAYIQTTIIFGQALLYIGIIAFFIGLVKKKSMIIRYSLESVIFGALMLFLYYSFYHQKIMLNFGFIYYYSLLMLGVLYIIISIIYTVIKVRK
ncbi:MAG: hypothetical protein ACM3UU_09670 [Ignavibacteriales bacterium]